MVLAPLALTKADPDMTDGEGALLRAVLGKDGADTPEGRARLAFWRAATGGKAAPSPEIDLVLAADIMALYCVMPAERLLARRGPMLDRAASTLRARAMPAPQGLRHAAGPGDFDRGTVRHPFAGFFAVEEFDMVFRRFDGSLSAPANREVFIGCDAVTVLPYDALRNRVLLIEQLRTGPMARGDANPWQLEAVAGRIDAGETPEGAARREAEEEAALVLGRLEPVAGYYPTTAALSEYLYSFVGLCDLPDGVAGVHGLAAEGENIRGHVLDLPEAISRMDAGEFGNAPLILSLQWLWRHHQRLRAEAGVQGI